MGALVPLNNQEPPSFSGSLSIKGQFFQSVIVSYCDFLALGHIVGCSLGLEGWQLPAWQA